MKLLMDWLKELLKKVAPRTGAWIETRYGSPDSRENHVAPRTGAWIETTSFLGASLAAGVAPRTGAWIETRMVSLAASS